MFMAKSELTNTWQLTKIRINNSKSNCNYFLLIVLILFLGNLIPTLVYLSKQADSVLGYSLQDYSIVYAVGVIISIVIMTCNYSETNKNYSVYPQTNTSRFLSAQALYHLWILLIAAVSLLFYLIQYAVIATIASSNENIVLVYKFDIGFVITGFFVLLVYAAIVTSVITLIGTLIRRFKMYAILLFALIAGLILTNMIVTWNILKKVFGFLIFEGNPVIFMLKGVVLWAVLFLTSLVINKYTVYYKSTLRVSKYIIAGIVVVGVIGIGGVSLLSSNAYKSYGTSESSIQELEGADGYHEIVIDASKIPAGTKIEIVTTNIIDETNSNIASSYSKEHNMDMRLSYEKEKIENFSGENITITYHFSGNMTNNYELTNFANPMLLAYLDGTTLHIDYSYNQNIKAVFLPVWSFMWQFKEYRGKDIYKEFLGSTSGGGNGYVFIDVEE